MKTNKLIKLLSIGILGLLLAAGCSGKNGSTGKTGATGTQGTLGNEGPANPTISWVMPVQGSTGIYTDAVIKVGFSKPISSSTINASTFLVSTGGINVTGTVSYNSGSQTAYFSPYAPLVQFGFYTATLTTGVTDTNGNQLLANYTWAFTVGGSLTPSRLYTSDFNNNSISVFNNAGSADGNIYPDRTVIGAATLLNEPSSIWLDKASDRLYVADYNASSILVFNNASTINGNAAPARVISGAATTLNAPYSVLYDAGSDSLYVPDCVTNSVLIFNSASTINGNVAPSRSISGASTTLACPLTVWYDATSDQLYVSNYDGQSVSVFSNASTATGNVAPSRTITGGNTTLSGPFPLWLDPISDQLYVGNYDSSSILVFNNASTADGNIAPSRTISGASTTLSELWGLFLDAANNRLYVMDPGAAGVLVFNSASTINGNVTPDRTITGSNTGFSYPTGIWLDMNP